MLGDLYFVYVAYGATVVRRPRAVSLLDRVLSALRVSPPATRGYPPEPSQAPRSAYAEPPIPVIGVSHNPLIDLAILADKGYDRLSISKGPLPLALADNEAQRVAGRLGVSPGYARFATSHEAVQRRIQSAEDTGASLVTRKGQPCMPQRAFLAASATLPDCDDVELPSDEDLEGVLRVLRGRMLYGREIRRALTERGLSISSPLEDILQVLIIRGPVERRPSVTVDRFGAVRCMRCGSRAIVEVACNSCGSDRCGYCTECASMGQARSCRPLYLAPAVSPAARAATDSPAALLPEASSIQDAGRVSLSFDLTAAQRDASRLVAEFVQTDARRECLVFAVCGAGKTEVSFRAIGRAIGRGGRVLFAVPRSDVVAELEPRVRTAFPDARVIGLRGAVRERYAEADVVVATTHQVIRFYQAFDLVILDEADAFPYRGSRMLRFALRRATAPSGKTVYMTATPEPALLARAERGDLALVRISARHHGHPLPEPLVLRAHLPPVRSPEPVVPVFAGSAASAFGGSAAPASVGSATSGRLRPAAPGCSRSCASVHSRSASPGLPAEVVAVIQEAILRGHKVFVFVPTVALSERIGAALTAALTCRGPADSGVGRPRSLDSGVWPLPGADSSAEQLPDSNPAAESCVGPESCSGARSGTVAGVGDRALPRRTAALLDPPQRRVEVAWIHSRHPRRDAMREEFRSGTTDVLVTTTLMERGITVPNADVVVLYADFESVFDAGTLIQMAGRAGRSADYPCASVYFVAERISAAMRLAVESIRTMNRHAAAAGYLVTPLGVVSEHR